MRILPAKGAVRLAAALSGAAVPGLALVPAASASTTPRAIPKISSDQCSLLTDGETYAEAYCPYPPGEFAVYIVCSFGNENLWIEPGNRPAAEGLPTRGAQTINSSPWMELLSRVDELRRALVQFT